MSLSIFSVILLVMFFFVPESFADWKPGNLNFKMELSHRTDDLNWNIAGDKSGHNPNIVSELHWDDLEIYQVNAGISFDMKTTEQIPSITTHFELRGGYGKIFDGDVRDSDYGGDNRSFETSRSLSNADDGDVLDLSIAVGPRFKLLEGCVSLTPLIGYSYHEQNLTLTHGHQVLPQFMPIIGLDSTYDTEWRGWWAGLDMNYQFNEKVNIFSKIEYHWVDYTAIGDWNLRTNMAHPKSFKHSADGHGWTAGIGVDYSFSEHFSAGIHGSFLKWDTDAGTDDVYYTNGTVTKTRLNEVNWKSISCGICFLWRF